MFGNWVEDGGQTPSYQNAEALLHVHNILLHKAELTTGDPELSNHCAYSTWS